MKITRGYYWIRFKGEEEPNEETIGYYDHEGTLLGDYGTETYSDGSGTPGDCYTWIVVGSDETFKNKEIEVIRRIEK